MRIGNLNLNFEIMFSAQQCACKYDFFLNKSAVLYTTLNKTEKLVLNDDEKIINTIKCT